MSGHIETLGAIGGQAMSWNEAPQDQDGLLRPRRIAMSMRTIDRQTGSTGPQDQGGFPCTCIYTHDQAVAENMLKFSDKFTVILNIERFNNEYVRHLDGALKARRQ